jgi:hypothetical protein
MSQTDARIIWPGQLIGSATVCAMLHIDRSTLTRRVASGVIEPLARLDGGSGAFVFDRSDIEVLVK